MTVPGVFVSNYVSPIDLSQSAQLEDIAPRLDYVEIAHRIGAEITGYGLPSNPLSAWALKFERSLRLDLVEALSAVNRISKYSMIVSTSEKAAIPLSMLLSILRTKKPHVVMGHHMSSRNKSALFRVWPAYKTFSHIICVCQSQTDYVINQLGRPKSQVHFIYDSVDHHFFRPMNEDDGGYVLAVGQEQRDYDTLLQALEGTGIRVVIVASSLWSSKNAKPDENGMATVLRNIPYRELRTLYARARLVAVPLFDVDYAAGVNTILESMAMAKPVIVSRTKGIKDYIVPGETGMFVSQSNPEAWRETILSLWDDPAQRRQLGANARQRVQESMNLDVYVDRVEAIARNALAAG